MAASVSVKKRSKMYDRFLVIADVTMDNSYATGGEPLTANQFGLNVIDFVLPSPAAGYTFEFDHANSKLKAFAPVNIAAGDGTGASGTDNALIKGDGVIEVSGSGTALQLAGSQVANKADLSEIVVRVLAIGY